MDRVTAANFARLVDTVGGALRSIADDLGVLASTRIADPVDDKIAVIKADIQRLRAEIQEEEAKKKAL